MGFRLGFLYKGLDRDATAYWEIFVMSRKLILTAITVLLVDDPTNAGYISLWVLEACMVLHLLIMPYESSRCSRLELQSLLSCIVTFNVGVLYKDGITLGGFLDLIFFGSHLIVGIDFALGLRSETLYESR